MSTRHPVITATAAGATSTAASTHPPRASANSTACSANHPMSSSSPAMKTYGATVASVSHDSQPFFASLPFIVSGLVAALWPESTPPSETPIQPSSADQLTAVGARCARALTTARPKSAAPTTAIHPIAYIADQPLSRASHSRRSFGNDRPSNPTSATRARMGAIRYKGGANTRATRQGSTFVPSQLESGGTSAPGTYAIHAAATAPATIAATMTPTTDRTSRRTRNPDRPPLRAACQRSQSPWCIAMYDPIAPPPNATTAATSDAKASAGTTMMGAAIASSRWTIVNSTLHSNIGMTMPRCTSPSSSDRPAAGVFARLRATNAVAAITSANGTTATIAIRTGGADISAGSRGVV